ncbi:MAG: hypothetical protein HN849_03020 [Victivallales bacterium]|nr:hypothetical protein [Victivallales bacterium]
MTSVTGIAEVTCDQDSVERGEVARVLVQTQGRLAPGDVIRVQALDAGQRILLQLDQPAQPGKTEYRVEAPMGNWATIQVILEALLVRGGQEVARAETEVLVPKRRRGQFNFVQWAARTDVLNYYSWQKLAEAGWNISVAASAKTAPFDLTAIPYTTSLLEKLDKNGMMQPACWNDDAAIDAHVDKIVQKQLRTRDAGAFVYSLGDEGTTKGCCVHPACIEAYRAYLKEQYSTIAKLNASWGEKYVSFGEVDLLDRKDVTENGAAAQGKYARWYDRQAFSRHNLAMYTQRYVKAFKAFDTHALTGFEGTGGFGDDIDLLLESMPFWSPYPSIGDDIIRSVADRDHIRANWMGYHKNADPLINYSWRMVMKEMDSIWWWRYDGCGSWRGYIRPVLDFWPATAQLCEEMRPVREGLGDLLLRSQVHHSGIAIYYSLPSALCGKLGDNASFPSAKFAHTRWLSSIYSQGLDVRYVTSGAIARGALKNDGYRTLILGIASAMPEADVAAIREFVRAGGTVVADLRPAIMDGHCKPLERGALDDIFGIARATSRKAGKVKIQTIAVPGRKTPVSLKGAELRIDRAVSAASAKALATVDGTPVMLVNQFGKGKTILANLEIADPLGNSGPETPILQIVNGLLTEAGITPAVRLRAPDGGPLPGFETRVWENGNMTIVGIWRTMAVRFYGEDGVAKSAAGLPVLATLPADKVVYDLRNGRCLGSVREFRTSVQTGRANFFALLPRQLAAPQLRFASPPVAMQDTVLTIKLPGIADPATSVAVYAEVVAPDGSTPVWGRKPVILKGGTGQFTFRTARNDMPGTWRVRVKELFSNHQSELTWASTAR